MHIIIDTREQNLLFIEYFKGLKVRTIYNDKYKEHTFEVRKLDEGDYAIPELEDCLVIERKSLIDLYGTTCNKKNHDRFSIELMSARLKGKRVYVFVEGSLQDFITHRFPGGWYRNSPKPPALASMIETISERYGVIWVWCRDRADMENKILVCFDVWLKLRGITNESK